MKRCGIPAWIYLAMAVFFVRGADLSRVLTCVDYFGGECGVRDSWLESDYPAMAHELKHDKIYQDINSNEGFLMAMLFGGKIRRGGLGAWGVVCSTWIWMARKSVGRHLHPMGNRDQEVLSVSKLGHYIRT